LRWNATEAFCGFLFVGPFYCYVVWNVQNPGSAITCSNPLSLWSFFVCYSDWNIVAYIIFAAMVNQTFSTQEGREIAGCRCLLVCCIALPRSASIPDSG
jgi:hypothetical protein